MTEVPVVVPNIGRTGTTITIVGEGWIEAATAAAFATAISGLSGANRISGVAFTIYGIGEAVEYQILPQACVDGGPHVGFEIGEQTASLVKPITFNVTATTYETIGSTTQQGYTETISVGADGLRSVTREGKLLSGTVATALSAFKGVYPPNAWVIQYRSSTDQNGLNLTYTITADELLVPYDNAQSDTSEIVDGEGTYRTERDEQYRITSTYEYDLMVTGNYLDVLDMLRADAVDQESSLNPQEDSEDEGNEAVILRESMEVTLFKHVHLQASFTFLRGADANRLLNWMQSLASTGNDDAYTIQQYNGADAVLILQPATVNRVVQSGEAIGLGAYPREPDALFDDALLERPQVTLSQVSELEFKTTWSFTMAAPNDFDRNSYLDQLARPSDPGFYGE